MIDPNAVRYGGQGAANYEQLSPQKTGDPNAPANPWDIAIDLFDEGQIAAPTSQGAFNYLRQSPWTHTGNIPIDFTLIVQQALIQGGVSANKLTLNQITAVARSAWNDSSVRLLYDQWRGVTPNVGITILPQNIVTLLATEFFTPGQSTDGGMLQLGISLLTQQGQKLSGPQQQVQASGTTQVPKPFAGNFGISKDFGQGGFGGTEEGIDYETPVGTQLFTPFAGTIHIDSSGTSNWGLRVMVKLPNGWTFAIGHMTEASVKEGDTVAPGQVLGYSGGAVGDPNSGVSDGPHIEVQWMNPAGEFQNPHSILDPILLGTTFSQINEMTAIGDTGLFKPDFPGQDQFLEKLYPGLKSAWSQFFATPITGNQILGIVGALGTQPATGQSGGVVAGTPQEYQSIIAQAAQTSGVPVALLSALLKQESGFDPTAKSEAGALGIAQFMPGTAAGLGIDPLNPQQAIPGAAQLLAQYYREFGTWRLALAAYNAGEGAVKANGEAAAQPTYIDNIMAMATAAGMAGGGGVQSALDQTAVQRYLENLPSHIPGMNMGQYKSMQAMADSAMQTYFGHTATDSIVKDLWDQNILNPSEARNWVASLSTTDIKSPQYNQIYNANQGALVNIYNQRPGSFDPRIAQAQYQQTQPQQPPPEPPPPIKDASTGRIGGYA